MIARQTREGRDCSDIQLRNPSATSGVYPIYAPHIYQFYCGGDTEYGAVNKVYCDMDTGNGGWTVGFQF